jgi:hypothetical protein
MTEEQFNCVDHLTRRKTKDICERHHYKVTGFTLTNINGEKCVVDMSAVRWLTNSEFWDLMHPDSVDSKKLEQHYQELLKEVQAWREYTAAYDAWFTSTTLSGTPERMAEYERYEAAAEAHRPYFHKAIKDSK